MTERPHITVRDWRRIRYTLPREHRERGVCWWWLYCTNQPRCNHYAAIAVAPLIIRWGPDAWPDMMRRHGRCSACGARGLKLGHPSWGGLGEGWAPFPIDKLAPVPEIR